MRILMTPVLLTIIGAAMAQDAQHPQQRLTPKEIQWPASAQAVGTSNVAGIQTVVVKGDPTKAGLYTLMLKVPPNVKIQAHSHADDRTAVVVSGTWYFGYGRE